MSGLSTCSSRRKRSERFGSHVYDPSIPKEQTQKQIAADLLERVFENSARSMVETAKCDAWATTELSAEEDVYDASHKFASYVDVVFSEIDMRLCFSLHEQFAGKLVELLRLAPDTPSAAEVCVRRCYFGGDSGVREGFSCTLNVSGYGNDDASARQSWGVGLKLMGNAIVQLSARGAG